MWRFKIILMGILGVLFLSGLTQVSAAQMGSNTQMRSVSGEISAIDVKLGLLQLKSDAGQDTRDITEYRINQDETRVTDPADTKFLVIKDLGVGQHVTIKLIDKPGELMVRKIVAEPMLEPVLQEVTGELKAIDFQAGTLIIAEKPIPEGKEYGYLSDFVFQPKEIIVRQNPDIQTEQLELKPGDFVQVEFVEKDKERQAHSITLLKPIQETTSTTTTTVTSTTVTQ